MSVNCMYCVNCVFAWTDCVALCVKLIVNTYTIAVMLINKSMSVVWPISLILTL